MTLKKFTHIEESVEALRFGVDTQVEIIAALSNEAQAGLLSTLDITNGDNGLYNISFRYKSSTTPVTLTEGSYFVKSNIGTYNVMSAAEFNKLYIDIGDDEVTVKDLAVKFAKANGVEVEDDVTEEQIAAAVEALPYDEIGNNLTVNFANAGISNVDGLGEILKAVAKSSKINSNTKFILQFSNTEETESANAFNLIELQKIVGEVKQVTVAQAKHIVLAKFNNAVNRTVTGAQWTEFSDELMRVTGISSSSDITK